MPPLSAIDAFLDRVRTRLWRWAIVRTCAYLAASISVWGSAAVLWASAAGPALGTRGFWLIMAVLALGSCGLCLQLTLELRRFRRRRELAMYVGLHVPEVASDLLSVVELSGARDPLGSSDLIAGLVDHTACEVDKLAPQVAAPTPWRRPVAVVVSGGIVVCVVMLLGDPQAGWHNLFKPPVRSAFADAKPVHTPLLVDASFELHAPAYTGRTQVILPSASGDIRALPGTRVVLSAQTARRVHAAELVFGDDFEHESLALAVDGNVVRGEFMVKDETRYRVKLHPNGGQPLIEVNPHVITLEIDAPPTVELHAPADELEVEERRQIELGYVVSDDFGVAKLDLVWETEGQTSRKVIDLSTANSRQGQGRFLWDLADVDLRPGKRVTYYLESADGNTVTGPGVGRSRQYVLKVYSPREQHEEMWRVQAELLDRLVRDLGARLTAGNNDGPVHQALLNASHRTVALLSTALAGLSGDKLADSELAESLTSMRSRLDKLVARQAKLLKRAPAGALPPSLGSKLQAANTSHIGELENDAIELDNWLDRQQLENLLAARDDLGAAQDRLKSLLAELSHTDSDSRREEVLRQLAALRRSIRDIEQRYARLASDVVDQFVNQDAIAMREQRDCLAEVEDAVRRGDIEAASAELEKCLTEQQQSKQSLEQSLSDLRGDRFGSAEQALGELRSDIADLAKDQRELAQDVNTLAKQISKVSDDAASEIQKEVSSEVKRTIAKLRTQLGRIERPSLSRFSRREHDAVRERLGDLERAIARSNVKDALSMAEEAEASLEAMESDIEGQKARGKARRSANRRARDQVRDARDHAEDLVDMLKQSLPSRRALLKGRSGKRLELLRKRQVALRRRTQKLSSKVRNTKLPGKAQATAETGLEQSSGAMKNTEGKLGNADPSGAGQEAQEAARSLDKLQREMQRSARNGGAMRQQIREPIRLPDPKEFRAPRAFREDIIDAMKDLDVPRGYQDLVKQFYKELVR